MRALGEGQYVKHFQYGYGVITESDAERTTIDFDLHGIKKFVTSLVVLEPASGTPARGGRSATKRRKKTASAAPPAESATGAK